MDLEQITKFIHTHNRSRLERLIALAPKKKRVFFELLPLIFHCNHNALPAYIAETPVGIRGYQCSEELFQNTKKYFPSFSHTRHAYASYPLEGLYLLNESGELSFPKQAKFGLWLVYNSSINDQQIALLERKLKALLVWANTLDIKINARLFNETAITSHSIASDELDILYSSGITIAGATPLWHYLSPEQTENHQQSTEIVINQLSREVITLDFGPLTTRNPSVITKHAVEAGLATISDCLPSYLELVFNLVLLRQDLNKTWLANQHKALLFNQQTSSFIYDPNLLKLNLIEAYLPQNLQLWAQRALYLKCQERLSILVNAPMHAWRRESLNDLIQKWQWHHSEIVSLDQRDTASMRHRLDEFAVTKKLINDLNEQLGGFIQQHNSDDAQQHLQLQKQYEDTFEVLPGVIKQLPESLLPETAEESLYIEFNSTEQKWSITENNNSDTAKSNVKPLYANTSLLYVLASAICNGALSKYTRTQLLSNNGVISTDGIHQLIAYLLKSPLASKEAQENDLTWLMFANMHDTPKEAYKQQDVRLSLYLRDPLNYGYHRRNLILDVEVLAFEKGEKWHYFSYEGQTATNEALASLIRWQDQLGQSNYIDSWCPTVNFSKSIIKRLNLLAENISQHYSQSHENGKYLYEIGDRNAFLHWQDGIVESILSRSPLTLEDELAKPTTNYIDVEVDSHLDRDGLFSLLLKSRRENQIQVFINNRKTHVDIFIIDELGHVFKQSFQGLQESTLINSFSHFLNDISQRNSLEQIKLYKLNNKDGDWTTLPIQIDHSTTQQDYLPVKVILREPTSSSDCSIHFNQQQFQGRANDPELFHQIYDVVIQLRNANVLSPLHISSINFVGDKPISSYYYITYKQRLEKILNLK